MTTFSYEDNDGNRVEMEVTGFEIDERPDDTEDKTALPETILATIAYLKHGYPFQTERHGVN